MKSFEILGGKARVVELPEGATGVRLHGPDNMGHTALIYNGEAFYCIPAGNWQIVGMLPEVTEEQAATLVEKVMGGQHFQNYVFTSVIDRWVKTAIESLESAICAEGYSFINPISVPQIPDGSNGTDYEAMDELRDEWNAAQSRVLCRDRTLILKKI